VFRKIDDPEIDRQWAVTRDLQWCT